MKLLYSPTSPFARKVLACAITRGLDRRIERVPVDAQASGPELVAANPLSKVPTLITEDGLALYDSPVICEYLDSLGDAVGLFPPSGGARWLALRFQAMGDGIMDAAVLRRGESTRPAEAARDKVIARQAAAVARALDALEADPPHHGLDIGSLTVACALGYLDFRYAHEAWRDGRPALAAWFAAISREPGLAETAP